MSSDTLFKRNFLARLPNTKSMASITLDLPDPFGPTTEEKHLWNGPMVFVPAYDLKFSSSILVIMSRDGFVGVVVVVVVGDGSSSATLTSTSTGGADAVDVSSAMVMMRLLLLLWK